MFLSSASGLTAVFLLSVLLCVSKASADIHASEICSTCSTTASRWLCMLPDDNLYEGGILKVLPFGTDGCLISDASKCSSCACNLYVKAHTKGPASTGSYDGWPRTVKKSLGTGCVKAPYLSKGVRTCYYTDSRYQLSTAQIALMCTTDGKKNALAQLRHALCNGQCGVWRPVIAFDNSIGDLAS